MRITLVCKLISKNERLQIPFDLGELNREWDRHLLFEVEASRVNLRSCLRFQPPYRLSNSPRQQDRKHLYCVYKISRCRDVLDATKTIIRVSGASFALWKCSRVSVGLDVKRYHLVTDTLEAPGTQLAV
jgi:hypothetical protein